MDSESDQESYEGSEEYLEDEEEVELTEDVKSVITTLLPHQPICDCGRTLDHHDFIRFLLMSGWTMSEVEDKLNLLSIRLDCCSAHYQEIDQEEIEEISSKFKKIVKILTSSKEEMLFDPREIRIVSASILYLLLRGVGSDVICHLLQLPYLKSLKKFNAEIPDDMECFRCDTCLTIVPNSEAIKLLFNGGKILSRYVDHYDCPRNCCLRHLKVLADEEWEQNDEFTTPDELNGLINSIIISENRGVPTEETDYVLCRDCGTHVGGIADDSDLTPIKKREYNPHISGDCIRQASRWGLPMEFGFICHGINRRCCRGTINKGDIRIMPSLEYSKRRENQNFASTFHVCR
jgi:hypothetical protein